MDHHRSNYRPRHRRAVQPSSDPRQAPGSHEPARAGFRPRSALTLTVLSIVALAAWLPYHLGRGGADTLDTANGSPVAIESQQTSPVDAASTAASSKNGSEASRSEQRTPISGSSVPAAPSASSTLSPLASPSTDASAEAAGSPEAGTPGSPVETAKVVVLVNAARADAGCGPVRRDPRLDDASLAHSEDMIARDYFSHTTPDGVSPWDRAKAAGYDVPTGENIALGQPDADTVMEAWMNSEGHRANILNCSSKAIGVGLALDSSGTPYWTQMFGAE
jgi:uncharacterized protein YkwD